MFRNLLKNIGLTIITIPLLYLLWLLLRVCVFDYFTIPSESMMPTLRPGDKVVVNKLLMGGRIYKDFNFDKEGQELQSWRLKGLRWVQHNDICVFNYPKHKNRISFVINHCFCKRCVALPGDTLSIVGGYYRNNNYRDSLGLPCEQEKLAAMPDSLFPTKKLLGRKLGWTVHEFGPLYIPRKDDQIPITPREALLYKHILQWELGGKTLRWDNATGIVTADNDTLHTHVWQHNYYFMAGDNVCSSNDSRYWGLVPEEYIIGIVGWIVSK